MRLEYAGGRELAEFMTDHIFSDVNGDECLAVMHIEGVADEIGSDGRTTGPSLNGLLILRGDGLLDFLE